MWGDNMDFSVKDFNVRLRTIKLWEAAVAMVVCFVLTFFFCSYFGIMDEDLEYVIYFVFMILFFVAVSIGTDGFRKDFDTLFSGLTPFKVIILAVLNNLFALSIAGLISNNIISVNNFVLPFVDVGGLISPYINAMGIDSTFAFVLEVVSAVCIAPVSEELLFRAVLFNRIKIKKGVFWGMLISSLLFSVGHFYGPQPYVHLFTSFMFGLLMCVFYLKYDNILMNITVHLLGNLMLYIHDYTPLFDFIYYDPFNGILGLVALFSLLFIPVYIFYYAVKLK